MEGVDRAADDRIGREVGQGRFQTRLRSLEHPLHGRIGIDDVEIRVRDHHVHVGRVQRTANAGRLRGDAHLILDLKAQPDLHRLDPQEHRTDLVVAIDG